MKLLIMVAPSIFPACNKMFYLIQKDKYYITADTVSKNFFTSPINICMPLSTF
jgi:hypothetical protein